MVAGANLASEPGSAICAGHRRSDSTV